MPSMMFVTRILTRRMSNTMTMVAAAGGRDRGGGDAAQRVIETETHVYAVLLLSSHLYFEHRHGYCCYEHQHDDEIQREIPFSGVGCKRGSIWMPGQKCSLVRRLERPPPHLGVAGLTARAAMVKTPG